MPVASLRQGPKAQAQPVPALARARVDARVLRSRVQDELLPGERPALA